LITTKEDVAVENLIKTVTVGYQ